VGDVEKIVQFLEDEGLPFTWKTVGRAVETCALEVEDEPYAYEVIAQEVINEGIRRSVGVAGKFLELLGVPFPTRVEFSHDIELQLLWGKEVSLWCFSRKGKFHLERGVEDPLIGEITKKQTFPLPDPKPLRAIGEIGLDVRPGRAVLRTPAYAPDLAVAKGRAFFRIRTYELEELKKVSRKVKALAPLLSLMGVEDLREAIEALGGLREGEIRAQGPYVLVRGEGFLALRRGAIFADPELDGALLVGRNINLVFPEEVEVSFRPYWSSGRMSLHELKIRWKDEVFHGGKGFLADSLLRNPVVEAIRNGLREEFERLESRPSSSFLENASPRMLAFLRAFATHEDPFQALAEGGLRHYATAQLFADL
jgi:hypothetical protein